MTDEPTKLPSLEPQGIASMSLRDYFAAQALVGLLSYQQQGYADPAASFATRAYVLADAMLAQSAVGAPTDFDKKLF